MVQKLDLYDYRRRVAEQYHQVRNSDLDQPEKLAVFRKTREELIAHHPQSPLFESRRRTFKGLSFYPYDPVYRFVLDLKPVATPAAATIKLRQDGNFSYEPVGDVEFKIGDTQCKLTIFWILGYGGGLFLPFRDATNGKETYGGGRYLIDTIKGADLGHLDGALVVDFNYAYNPSCAYDEIWQCPLPPLENRLEVPIEAGEKLGDFSREHNGIR